MKAKEKRMIAILILITAVVCVIFVVRNRAANSPKESAEVGEEFVDKRSDGTRVNNSEKLQEPKTLEGLEISDFQLSEKDNMTVLLGKVTNKSDQVQGGYIVDIKILDKEGNEITTVSTYIRKLEKDEVTDFNISATFDYANAYDFKVVKNTNAEQVNIPEE